jgi:hypothetical protein
MLRSLTSVSSMDGPCVVVSASACFSGPGFKYVRVVNDPEVLYGFPQSLQANVTIAP